MHEIIIQDMEELAQRPGLALEKLRGSTVLVAGGNSMLGKYLAWLFCFLNERKGFGITLYVLVRNLEKAKTSYQEWADRDYFYFLHQDICEPIGLKNMRPPEKVDFIFHVAGSASASFIARDPVGIIRANTLGTTNMLEFARQTKAQVVFASTREVYGKLPESITRIKEDDMGVLDPIHPRNSYPESKKMAEALLVSYEKQYGVAYTLLRIAHAYGPGMEINNDGRVMADFIGAVVHKQDIVLNSDGSACRSFCYITDCIDGILRAALCSSAQKMFNLANETEPQMIRDVAQSLIGTFPELDLKVKFSTEAGGIHQGGYNPIPMVSLDTTRIESIGWKPLVRLQEGMKRTVLSFW